MSGNWRRIVAWAGILIVGVASVGCGNRGYDGDRRYPLAGKVTFDGEPVDLGSISFLPSAEGGKQRVSGGQIEDGKFSVPEEQGANAGKYRVEIHWAKKTGKQHYDSELQMNVDDRKEALPRKFHSESILTADVSADKTSFDFELSSK